MPKILTSELLSQALDWAVCAAQHNADTSEHAYTRVHPGTDENGRSRLYLSNEFGHIFQPSEDASQCAQIMLSNGIFPVPTQYISNEDGTFDFVETFRAKSPKDVFEFNDGSIGQTPWVAVCRCFVRNKLGDVIDVPDWVFQG